MAGMALKGQYNLVSIMVPPEVSMKEKFSQENRKTMFIAENLTVMLHFLYCLWIYSAKAFRNLIIYIRAIFSILKIIKEFIMTRRRHEISFSTAHTRFREIPNGSHCRSQNHSNDHNDEETFSRYF